MCEEYKLHRETFYLAADMYDRFVDTERGIQKEQLQRLGITCLFVAAKIEVYMCVARHVFLRVFKLR